MTTVARRVLITALGVAPRLSRYSFRSPREASVHPARTHETKLAPVALINLLPEVERPQLVYALCTTKAREETYPILVEELANLCEAIPVEVPDDDSDLAEFLRRVTTLPIGPDTELIVDFTHGYRHHTFLTFMAALYLSALRSVRIRAAYYGLFDGPSSPAPPPPPVHVEPRPSTGYLFDVRPLLELPQWFHAVQMLRATGSAKAIARLVAEFGERGEPRHLSALLEQLSESYQSGLPLEVGRDIVRLRTQSRSLKRLLKEHQLPLGDELVDQMLDQLAPLDPATIPGGQSWKRDVSLDETELRRQAELVDALWESGALSQACGLMREWLVSWVLWLDGTAAGSWHRSVRRKGERYLNALSVLADRAHPLTDEQRALASFWSNLRDVRNAYHHHGMRYQEVARNGSDFSTKLHCVRNAWPRFRTCPRFDLTLPIKGTGTVLVSPVGTSPGALFSAVAAVRGRGYEPDVCVIIGSNATAASAQEALNRAEYANQRDLVVLRDPFGGVNELKDVVNQRELTLLGAERVYVNLTGGTTLMGLLVSTVAERAGRLGVPVHRFGLIDRRSPQEQAADPYQVGEPYWISNPEEGV